MILGNIVKYILAKFFLGQTSLQIQNSPETSKERIIIYRLKKHCSPVHHRMRRRTRCSYDFFV